MDELLDDVRVGDITCENCKMAVASIVTTCTNCAFPIGGTDEEKKKFRAKQVVNNLNLEDYQQQIKTARSALFVIAGIITVSGLFLWMTMDVGGVFVFLISLVIALLFVGLGYWAKKKAYAAILTGIIVFALILLTDAIDDPLSIFKGILMKGFIIYYLVKGLKSAKQAEQLKKEIAINELESIS